MTRALSVVVVTHNHGRWIEQCLASVQEHAADAEIVVIDNESTDGTADKMAERFPGVRVIPSPNHGFAWGCNRGLEATDSRYVLFLNPDTAIRDGSLAELCEQMDARPDVAIAGVRQVDPEGRLELTIRRFPSALRMLGEALGSERAPTDIAILGERVRDAAAYDRETECDWTAGSFLFARRSAIDRVGAFDERFFMYMEEIDLCLRLRNAGMRTLHLPSMEVLHAEGLGRGSPRMEAQVAWARLLYARKNFSRPRRAAFRFALLLRYGLRALGRGERAEAARAALAVAAGRVRAPFADLEATR